MGRVIIPQVPLTGTVDFVIDTGADDTVLMPNEMTMLGVNYKTLVGQECDDVLGFGGEMEGKNVAATVVLRDLKYEYEFDVSLMVVKPDLDKGWLLDLPSVMGRDVLNRVRFVSDFPQGNTTISPKQWDRRVLRTVRPIPR